MRFYAGAPLIDADGCALGTLCILDKVPRDLSLEQQEALAILSRQVMTQLNLRRNVVQLQESVERYRQADQARQKSEQKLALHFQQTPVAVIEWDLNFEIVGWNQAAEKIFGYSRNEAIGCHAAGLLVPISARCDVDRVMNDLLAQKGRTYNTDPNLTKDGRVIICEWHNTPLIDALGAVIGVASIAQDITDRFLAEKALQSSLVTNHALIEAMPDLIFRLSSDGIFVNYKVGKGNNLLLPPNEFLSKNIYEVMPQEVAELIMNCIKQALATKDVQICEYQLVANQNIFYCEARIAMSAKNEVIAIVRDITERKQAEAEIRNALASEKHLGELKSRFITMTSHEFRTPLTTILSSAELLEDFGESWSQEKQNQHLHRIQTNVKHMTQLLEDVMLIGKAEMGKLASNPILLDVVQFCRDLINDILISAEHSHNVFFDSQNNSFDAYLDNRLLHSILSNLLSNAIKYSPAGGTVNFNFVCRQNEITFQIQDEGIGIPISEQAYLFDSFYRVSNVGNISGTGLGLAIVKKAVDSLHGKIAVQSEIGVGTTFIISLPLNLGKNI